jgi:hypothetical protein
MKKLVLLGCVFLCAAGFVAAQTKAELQQMYMSYLQDGNYAPSVDDDGDIYFKFEGGNYYIIVDEDDPAYFRIIYPNFWEIESEEERTKASAVIMSANRTTKLAKVYITSWDNTSIDADVLLNTAQDFKNHFSRMLDAMQIVCRKFVDGMDE